MMNRTFFLREGIFLALLWFFAGTAAAAQIEDTESAAHDSDAANHSIVDTYSFPGFEVIQFNLPVLSVYSYMLISAKKSLAVDPVRDIDIYLETAKQKDVEITGVYLSHSHADFVAGHIEMVRAVNCPIFQAEKSGVKYETNPLKDGTKFTLGSAQLEFIDTPGHTPDGGCLLVYSEDDVAHPKLMFTGDVLFVGSVGRPDLMEGTVFAARLASAMFDSWNGKLSKLADSVMVFPAHGAGSLCGAHLSDEPFSTIGKEKTSNPYLQHRSRGAFIAAVLEGLPEAPQYFKYNAQRNKNGPPLVAWKAPLPSPIAATESLADPKNTYVVDVRTAEQYAVGHIPNAINIGVRGRLETWVGIMIPWQAKLVLCGSEEELKECVRRLYRVGYGPEIITLEAWEKAGLPVTIGNPISAKELYALMQQEQAPLIIDVRLPQEWMALRIGTVLNLPLNHLSELASQLDPSEPVVTVCNSAYRSSMAVGILERQGFSQARNLEGGSEAWIAAGYPLTEVGAGTSPSAAASTGTSASVAPGPKQAVRLPERMSPVELKRLIMDLPGTFELFDIRPAEHFADYHLPGAVNVDVNDLMHNPKYLVGVGPLIVVDRDGSIAMAVGGVLSQKTQRTIKVLYNGLEGYWSETQGRTGSGFTPPVMPAAPETPPTLAPGAFPPPAKPAKKSAGC